ncbi:MAG: ROK family protein, partial [Pseudomonadota bacterium]|nr:ROK family protein [Pseudomonadota bacterium]
MQHGGRKILVIDLGGTNLRAAFGNPEDNELSDVQKIKLDCINEFYKILGELIDRYPNTKDLVVSVAGPKNGDSITMTNRNWKIVSSEVKEKFGLSSCHLLNDWEAIAYSLSSLKESDLRVLKSGPYVGLNDVPKFVIGPGTGLGAALYSRINNFEHVNPTELGNTKASVSHYLEIFGIEESSDFEILEDVLSGPGISRVAENFLNESISAEEILKRATNNDSICKDLIQKYIQCFAVLSSESALS